MSDVTQILSKIQSGDPGAAEQLLPLVYEELRKLAEARMNSERSDHTLQATGLVHEAYVRLVDVREAARWDSRGHFFAAASTAMRRILVEHAREKAAQKRGGGRQRLNIDSAQLIETASPADVLAIDEAIDALAELDRVAASLVQLRYFAGISVAEAAESLSISVATAYRHWNYARAWLHGELAESDDWR